MRLIATLTWQLALVAVTLSPAMAFTSPSQSSPVMMLTTSSIVRHQRSMSTMSLKMAAPERTDTDTDKKKMKMTEQQRLSLKDEVRADAESALQNTGWLMPSNNNNNNGSNNAEDDGGDMMAGNDPFVQAINAGIQRDMGVDLEELLNPAKVVNLERDLYTLRVQLAEQTQRDISGTTTGTGTGTDTGTIPFLTTELADGGGGGEYADSLRKSIAKKEASLTIERRSVFRGWLKNIFLGQAIISFGLSYVMATDPAALFGSFDWFLNKQNNMDIAISVLGYWWWWLFVIPSLRSRRPRGLEKQALDIAFLASPAVSLIAPAVTRDTGIIWAANFAVVAASYGYALAVADVDGDDNDNDDDGDDSKTTPAFVKFLYKSLDFGGGRERGARN